MLLIIWYIMLCGACDHFAHVDVNAKIVHWWDSIVIAAVTGVQSAISQRQLCFLLPVQDCCWRN